MFAAVARWLFIVAMVALMTHPGRSETPPTDISGDPLPPHAVARMGTLRFRPGNASFCFNLSCDGKAVISGEHEQCIVRLWELATGKEMRSVTLPTGYYFLNIAFSPDGKLFAAHVDNLYPISHPPWDEHSIYIGQTDPGKILHRFNDKGSGFRSMAFSPDGKFLVACRGGGWVSNETTPDLVVWEVATGKERHKFDQVVEYAFSPDGRQLTTGAPDGSLRLHDAGSGKEIRSFRGHRRSIRCLAFSPDGKQLASGDGEVAKRLIVLGEERTAEPSPDVTLRLWDVAGGKELYCWGNHVEAVRRVLFSADSKTLAGVDEQNNLTLRDTANGKEMLRFAGKSRGSRSFAFSPDGKTLLRVHDDDTLRESDLATGKEKYRWPGKLVDLDGFCLSADGTKLVSGGLDVYDLATRRRLHGFSGHHAAIQELKFSGEAKRLTSWDETNFLRLWDSATGKPLAVFGGNETTLSWCSGFSLDQARLVVVDPDLVAQTYDLATGKRLCRFSVGTRMTVRHWEAATGWSEGSFLYRPPPAHCLLLSPNSETLAVIREDNTIRLWDTATGQEYAKLRGHISPIRQIAFLLDGKQLATACRNVIRIWELPGGNERYCLNASGFQVFPDGNRLSFWSADAIHIWDVAAGKESARVKGIEGAESGYTFSGDGSTLVTLLRNRTVRTWDAASGRQLGLMQGGEYEFTAGDSLLSPDGRLYVHMSMDPKHTRYSLREVETGREVCRTAGNWFYEKFTLSPNGKTLATAKDKIMFRELASGAELNPSLRGHRGRITALGFSPDGKQVATGSTDSTILLWNWSAAVGLQQTDRNDLREDHMNEAWAHLAAPDATQAYQAVGKLASAGDKSVAWLRAHLRPVSQQEREPIRLEVANLDSEKLAVREAAVRELTRLGADAVPVLHRTLVAGPPLEVVRRIEALLQQPELARWSSETLRRIRAVQALEQIGTAEARQFLRELAAGIPEARQTQEAKSALSRMPR
jgi:WD40 repeat protein